MNITLIFNPVFWIALYVLLSIFIKNNRIKKLLKITSLVLFLVISNNGVTNFFFGNLQYETLSGNEISEPYDIGIVLGPFVWRGTIYADGKEMTTFEHARFHDAIQLYKQGKFKNFLLAGHDKPDLAKSYLINLGIPSEDIFVEGLSKNTYENALLSKGLLDEKALSSNKILLITSAFHMSRAKKCFDKVGLKVTPMSVDYRDADLSLSARIWIIPNINTHKKWRIIFREWGSFLLFKVKNYI
jgi:Uncharacterized conserved protein